MAALSEIIPSPSSVLALETVAARRAVHFLQELNLHGSIFEGDSETSISAIKNQCFHHPNVGHIIKDIMSLVGSFHYFSLSYMTARQCFGTCSSPESETFFSYFSQHGVCSSYHLQGVCFRFPSNKITVLLFGRFLKKNQTIRILLILS